MGRLLCQARLSGRIAAADDWGMDVLAVVFWRGDFCCLQGRREVGLLLQAPNVLTSAYQTQGASGSLHTEPVLTCFLSTQH